MKYIKIFMSIIFCVIILSSCETKLPQNTNETLIETTTQETQARFTENDFEFLILSDNTAEIIRYLGEKTELNIPEELNGYKVTSIGENAFFRSNIKSITLSKWITKIKIGAFSSSPNLENVDIPPTVTAIGCEAFYKTPFLDNQKDNFFIINDILIKYNGNDEHVIIPEGVIAISNAFNFSKTLKSVIIPETVTEIGKRAFFSCGNLKNVDIPKSVDTIGYEAFDSAFLVGEINTDDKFIVINNILVHGKTYEDDLNIPENLGIKKIAPGALSENRYIKNAVIPDGVEEIGEYAFRECIYLKNLTIPDSVILIDSYAFLDCYNIKFLCYENSYAYQYSIDNNINYEIIQKGN